jgi:hypothetical protein
MKIVATIALIVSIGLTLYAMVEIIKDLRTKKK